MSEGLLGVGTSGLRERTERVLLGKEVLYLPEALNGQTSIFEHVLSLDTWNNVLDEEQRQRLKTFLPSFPEAEEDAAEKDETLRRLFQGENFKFGNPLQQFHQKLKDGLLSPEIARYKDLTAKFKKRENKIFVRNYYDRLIREVLVSRERTLNLRNGMPPDTPLPFRHTHRTDRSKGRKARTRKLYQRTLKEVREECNMEETSSEEEDSGTDPVQRSKRQLHRSLGPIPSPEPTLPSVVATFASKPVPLNGDLSGNDNKRPRPLSPVEITDEHYRQMLKRHKRRRRDEPNMPELDVSDITLQDVLNRCQASGKKNNKTVPAATNGDTRSEAESSGTSPAKKKGRVREKGERKLKRKVKGEKPEVGVIGEEAMVLQNSTPGLDVHSDLLTQRDDDAVPDFPLPDTLPARLSMGQADSFFSLLRDIVCDFPDNKATTAKLEERVREWQDSPACALNSWVHTQHSWVDCVVPALKFLSGDVLGLSVENFVPFLDYKERAQQWKWIGAGRDGNQQLSPLCRHWLKHRNLLPVDGLASSQGSPPPVRTTNFVVRPTTSQEKAMYQDQERRRIENPHRGFTYHLHGYDSVVGPIKGVYNKENAITKAREHALLVSDRPAFVTILTLVRDAAARLPNGEGTRSDICELLKDSQFLSPGVTDSQVNTVVSGALDRLHSEKDPCVKYDVNSKLWIYLHRSRTEEEFERIHQAQGAAAKAKKSMTRTKTSKIKDHMAQSATVKAALAAVGPGGDGDVKLDALGSLVPGAGAALTPPVKPPSDTAPHPASAAQTQPRTSKAKPNAAAAKAATAAIAAASASAAALHPNPHSHPSSPSPSPAHTPSRRPASSKAQQLTAAAKARTPVVNVAANNSASLLASRPQAISSQHNASLLSRASKPGTPPAVMVTKAPVVTVTKQGLTSKSGAASVTELARQHSPVVLAQESGSRSSTPTAVTVATPPPTGKLVTMPQTMAGVMSAADGAVLKQLVQQVVPVTSLQQRGLNPAVAQHRATTLKIQGGSIVQPMQLAGKPLLQLGGKGGQPLSVIQTSHGISTLSLIPQALSTTAQASTIGAASPAVTVNATKVAMAVNSNSGTSSPVTFMMGSAAPAQPKVTVFNTTGASTLHSQAKVVTPSQAGMVLTHQLTPAMSLRPGLAAAAASQAKMVATAGQAGLVPAQFIVQQAPHLNSNPAAAQGGPMMVSQASSMKGGQHNIQVMRTVLSPQGLKPGQATILISQPALQQAAASGTVISSAQVIHTAAATAKNSGRGGSPKGKNQPVYARIIQPPPGMKIMAGQQVQAPHGGMLVNKLLAGLPPGGAPSPVTLPSPSLLVGGAPAAVVNPQSLLQSQDVSDGGGAEAQT